MSLNEVLIFHHAI